MCQHSGGPHRGTACKETVQDCSNCRKLKLAKDLRSPSARDRDCPVYGREEEKFSQMIRQVHLNKHHPNKSITGQIHNYKHTTEGKTKQAARKGWTQGSAVQCRQREESHGNAISEEYCGCSRALSKISTGRSLQQAQTWTEGQGRGMSEAWHKGKNHVGVNE